MSDEPLYCPRCGAEDFGCDCDLEHFDGPALFCETCGERWPCPHPECYPRAGNERG